MEEQNQQSRQIEKSKKKFYKAWRFWLVVLIILVIVYWVVSIIVINYNLEKKITFSEKDKTSCENDKGQYKQVCARQEWKCLTVYFDGGNYCTSSNECEAGCYVSNPEVENIDDVIGNCQENNDICGCNLLIEDFKNDYGVLCID